MSKKHYDYVFQLNQEQPTSEITYTILKNRDNTKMKSLRQELIENVENWQKTQQTQEQNLEKDPNYWPNVRAEAKKLYAEAVEACRQASLEGQKEIYFGKIQDKNIAIHLEQLLREEQLKITTHFQSCEEVFTNLLPYCWLAISWK